MRGGWQGQGVGETRWSKGWGVKLFLLHNTELGQNSSRKQAWRHQSGVISLMRVTRSVVWRTAEIQLSNFVLPLHSFVIIILLEVVITKQKCLYGARHVTLPRNVHIFTLKKLDLPNLFE